MNKKPDPVYYGDYLQLDKLLQAQQPVSLNTAMKRTMRCYLLLYIKRTNCGLNRCCTRYIRFTGCFMRVTYPTKKLMTVVHRPSTSGVDSGTIESAN